MRFPTTNFWSGKKVLITGHTGFKGAWLAIWLSRMGAQISGISLPPVTSPNLYTLANVAHLTNSHFIDIRNAEAISNIIKQEAPDIVFHLAAQALVRSSYLLSLDTYSINIMGTTNILNAIRGQNTIKAVVAVTTDKVYKNYEQIRPYHEKDELGGYDPYSASKAASEIIISSYRDSYLAVQGVGVASARAGNVFGGGDWSHDRLIPDAIRAWDAKIPLKIRNPNSVRPWQHVLEPLNGYLVLAEKIYMNSSLDGAYNFGPEFDGLATVRMVVEKASQLYGDSSIIEFEEDNGPHEAGYLALDISKSRKILGIEPRWNLVEGLNRTIDWYQKLRNNVDAYSLCMADIQAYCIDECP